MSDNDNTVLHDAFASVGIRPGVDFRLKEGTTLSDCFGDRLRIGDTYVQGLWQTSSLPEFFAKLLQSPKALFRVLGQAARRSAVIQSREQTAEHYALGNEFYVRMLGSQKLPPVYTSAVWSGAHSSLERAQMRKLRLIAKKLKLKPGMRVLDVGGGWGGLAFYLAKYFKVEVHVLTIVKEQKEYGEKFCKGLPVHFHLLDYRDMTLGHFGGQLFDRVVTVEMIEHVGLPEQHVFFHQKAAEVLTSGGLLVHQVITTVYPVVDQWLHQEIFPNGVLLTLTEIQETSARAGFACIDVEELGEHYPPTLLTWRSNLMKHMKVLQEAGYTEKTFRRFDWYLSLCAVLFTTKLINLHQVVLRKQ